MDSHRQIQTNCLYLIYDNITQRGEINDLYFVRHGETDWNVKKKIQGKTDVPLNENGKQQAKELADMLLDRKKEGTLQVVRAYTSPTASCSTDGTGGGDRA